MLSSARCGSGRRSMDGMKDDMIMNRSLQRAWFGCGAVACVALAACEPTGATIDQPAPTADARLVPEAASNERIIAEALQACVAAFPDMRAVRSTLDRAGVRAEGAVPDLFIHTANRRTALIVTNTRGADPRCGFGIKDLRDEAAVSFADELVQDAFGGTARRISMEDRNGIAGWQATAGGEPVLVTVSRDVSVNPYFRGSLIVMSRDD